MDIDKFKLTASIAGPGNKFGVSVSFHNDTAVVGTMLSNIVYVYIRNEWGIWIEQAQLVPNVQTEDSFGQAVSIHNDTVVVGAPSQNMTGTAYVFVRNGETWAEQDQLTANNVGVTDNFAHAVAVHGDTIIIGAPKQFSPSTNPGAVYFFERNGTNWSEKQKLSANNAVGNDGFGSTVTIQEDIVIIGAEFDDNDAGDDAGAAYVLERNGSTWSEKKKLTATNATSGNRFGSSVALSGRIAVIGALFDDGNVSSSGSAYVFEQGATSWSLQQKLIANDGNAGERFGISVAIDGDTIVVGAVSGVAGGLSTDTYAYVFVRDENNWAPTEKLDTGSGILIDGSPNEFVSISGCNVLVGTEADDDGIGVCAGAAYLYLISSGCPCIKPPVGLIAWWTLDQSRSPATDSIGNNHGVWIGNPIPNTGIVDGALFFDETQHVEVPHHPSLNFGTDKSFTIDAWIKPMHEYNPDEYPRSTASIVDKQDLATGKGWGLRLRNGRPSFTISDGIGPGRKIEWIMGSAPLHHWTFLAIVVDRSISPGFVQYYQNGKRGHSFGLGMYSELPPIVNFDNTQPLLIANSGDPEDKYIGMIDEVEIFDRALNTDEVASIYNSFTGGKCRPCCKPPEGLVSWWPFDEKSGTLVKDIVGSNDGTNEGGATPAIGKVGVSLLFNGNNQRVSVADHFSLNFGSGGSFTIDCWVRLDSAMSGIGTIVEKWNPDNHVGFRLFHRSGILFFVMSDGSTNTFSYISTNKLSENSWQFLAVTVDRNIDEGHVYVNGMEDGGLFVPSTNAPGSISNTFPVFIGGNLSAKQGLRGRIDELEIFERALTPHEIECIFLGGPAGKCKPSDQASANSSYNKQEERNY